MSIEAVCAFNFPPKQCRSQIRPPSPDFCSIYLSFIIIKILDSLDAMAVRSVSTSNARRICEDGQSWCEAGGGNSRKHSTVNGTARSPTSRIAQSGSLQQKCRS